MGYCVASAKLRSGSVVASSPSTKVTAEEYLALDRAAEFRSEFIDGEIIAMSGGSMRHSGVKINLVGEVRDALRGTPCQAFDSDLRVRVSPCMYAYPDLTVVCGKPMLADDREDILLNPRVIFEVLSAVNRLLGSRREVSTLSRNRIADRLYSRRSGSSTD
jgi:Uma2 family endonuclease